MVIEDLKSGVSIVYGYFEKDSDIYITFFDDCTNKSEKEDNPFIGIYKNRSIDIFSKGRLGYPRFKPQRLATSQEKRWFQECINQNRLVPFKDIKTKIIHELW